MPIPLGQQRAAGSPVIKRRRIGEAFVGAIVNIEQRDAQDAAGKPRLNSKGTQATETVVTCLSMPATTMVAGIKGVDAVPEVGAEVRAIFVSGGLAQWIEAKGTLDDGVPNVGDILVMTSDRAVIYDMRGNEKGKLATQQDVDGYTVAPGESIAFRGEVRLRRAKPEEQEWVQRAEAAYHAATRIALGEQPAPATPASGVSAADLL